VAAPERLKNIGLDGGFVSGLIDNDLKILMLGTSFLKSPLEQAGKPPAETAAPYAYMQYQIQTELTWAAIDLCNFIESRGHKAYPIADFAGGEDLVASTRGEIPSVHANARIGVAAGLGELGMSGLLLTPQFGPRQRVVGVVTDAPIPISPIYNGPDLCTRCGKCVETCPTHALHGEQTVKIGDHEYKIACRHMGRCAWSIRYGLTPDSGSKYMGWQPVKTFPVPDDPTAEDIVEACANKDPLQVLGYQDPAHTDTIVEACLVNCPAGRK